VEEEEEERGRVLVRESILSKIVRVFACWIDREGDVRGKKEPSLGIGLGSTISK
jgi:hypothetical protein